MTPATALSDKAKVVLAYHRKKVLNNEPKFAACLIGTSCITSLDDLDAAYADLLEAGELEVVDKETGRPTLARSLYRCRPTVP